MERYHWSHAYAEGFQWDRRGGWALGLRGVSNWWKDISLFGSYLAESSNWFSNSIFRNVKDYRSTNFWNVPWLSAIRIQI